MDYEIMAIGDMQGLHESKQVVELVTAAVIKQGGQVTGTDDWGERPFAYNIKGRDRGYYAVMAVTVEPKLLKKVTTQLTLETDILRVLVTKKN